MKDRLPISSSKNTNAFTTMMSVVITEAREGRRDASPSGIKPPIASCSFLGDTNGVRRSVSPSLRLARTRVILITSDRTRRPYHYSLQAEQTGACQRGPYEPGLH